MVVLDVKSLQNHAKALKKSASGGRSPSWRTKSRVDPIYQAKIYNDTQNEILENLDFPGLFLYKVNFASKDSSDPTTVFSN